MKLILKQFGRHVDILIMAVTSLFIAGVAWANINSKLAEHEQKLASISTWQTQQVQQTNELEQTAARTEQKVDDMASNIQDIKTWLRNKK